MTPETVRAAAVLAYQQGLCVIPPMEDGSKRPLSEWKRYQSARPSSGQMKDWYGERAGIGLITGAVSGNLECVDFDDVETYEAFVALVTAAGLEALMKRIEDGYSERTPKGVHWLWFCEEIEGNQKLARRPTLPTEKKHDNDNVKALIETRGEGGFVVIAPSFGPVNAAGPYVVDSGALDTIAHITPAERTEILRLARSLDQMPPREPGARKVEERAGRPGDDFNQRASWEDILQPHGWDRVFTLHGVTHWRRPGKNDGVSATTNHAASDLFYVFSSSTSFEPERGYSKFSAWALLNYNSDWQAGAKRLAADGYGQQAVPFEGDEGERIAHWERNDTGNAELYAHLYGDKVRYDEKRGEWLVWEGHRWEWKGDGERWRLACTAARTRKAACKAYLTGDEQDAALKWAATSLGTGKIEAMFSGARYQHPINERDGRWDANPSLLGCPNGVIEGTTGTFRAGRPEDHITLSTRLAYNPEARCDRWERFLVEVFVEPDLISYIKRAVGYSLTGDTRERTWFLCFGEGYNGKSRFIEAIRSILGGVEADGYAGDIPRKAMSRGGMDDHPVDIAKLIGKRFVTCSEAGEIGSLDGDKIKALSAGDPQTARLMRENSFTFEPVLKLWLTANTLPRTLDMTEAFWDRVNLIPFTQRFDRGVNRDDNVKAQLTAEAPGILRWAVEGMREWYAQGLRPPNSVLLATLGYRSAVDPLTEWKTECCILDGQAWAERPVIWKSYAAWAERQRLPKGEVLGRNTLFRTLASEGYRATIRHGKPGFLGLCPGENFTPSDSEGEVLISVSHPPGYVQNEASHEINRESALKVHNFTPCPCSRSCQSDPKCADVTWWSDDGEGWHCANHHKQPGNSETG